MPSCACPRGMLAHAFVLLPGSDPQRLLECLYNTRYATSNLKACEVQTLHMKFAESHPTLCAIHRRNRRVAEAYTRAIREGKPRTFEDLETELLRGQKLQGVLTSNEVQEVLRVRDWEVRVGQ